MASISMENQQSETTGKETKLAEAAQSGSGELPPDVIIENQATTLDLKRMKMVGAAQRRCPELPLDMLPLILCHLSFLEYLSFRGVCQRWRLASLQFPMESQPTNQTLWLIFFHEMSSETTRGLLDPLNRKIYTIEIPELCGVRCCSSGHGWLLLCSPRRSSLFFFNPFTKAKIDVPYMDRFSAVTFTGPPTSPDCMVFGIGHFDHSFPYMVDVGICRRGDDKWTTKTLHTRRFRTFTHAVFCGGIFCCMDCDGKMGIFSAVDQAWSDLNGLRVDHSDTLYLLESGGRIMACCKNAYKGLVGVFLLEGLSWVKVDDIQDRTLYLGRISVSVLAANGTKNVVYFDTFKHGSVGVSYSLEDGTFDEHFVCHKYCTCSDFVWIEPRWIPPSTKLHWSA